MEFQRQNLVYQSLTIYKIVQIIGYMDSID